MILEIWVMKQYNIKLNHFNLNQKFYIIDFFKIIYIDKYNLKMKQFKKLEPQFPTFVNKNLNGQDQQTPNYHYQTNKMSSGSLNKYSRSPYLQKVARGFTLPKKGFPQQNNGISVQSNSRVKQQDHNIKIESKQSEKNDYRFALYKSSQQKGYSTEKKENPRSKSNLSMSSQQRQKGTKFKLPKLDMEYLKTDKKDKLTSNALSATLDVTTKKKKLVPIFHTFRSQVVVKTKAGTNGNQTKINQDIAITQSSLPHGVKLYCVCDGHGLNGHLVSAYIKQNLIKNLTTALKKHTTEPPKIQQIFQQCLAQTNDGLLNSDINTQLSGSTVIAVFIHNQTIYSFNIGDSRAILVSQQGEQNWKVIPLSDDHKPCRQDQKQRILKFGGRVEAQKNQRGQILGPLRVWMKDVQMPGLAMTRSFGDKAGIKAGTNGDPELMIHRIKQNDKFMVIASDGIWQYLENEQIMNIATPFYVKNDIDMAAQKMMRISTQIWHKISYSRDDITVIIVSLNPPNQKQSQELNYNLAAMRSNNSTQHS